MIHLPRLEIKTGEQREEDVSLANDLFHTGFCIVKNGTRTANSADARVREGISKCLISKVNSYVRRANEGGVSDEEIDSKEICQRHSFRYDMRLSFTRGQHGVTRQSKWNPLLSRMNRTAKRIVDLCEQMYGNAHGVRVNYAGVVVSFPSAPCQNWHVDGEEEGMYNIFCPLVDVTMQNGGTEFQERSHKHPLPEKKKKYAETMPSLDAEDFLIFDYRIKHRGLSNASINPRPILYLSYTRWPSQDKNFPAIPFSTLIKTKGAKHPVK